MIETIEEIARDAGEILMKYWKKNLEVKSKRTRDYDPVTEADLESEAYILERLSKEFPGDKILSEEEEAEIDFSGRVWVVDPLDGTREFLNGEEGFGAVIGLMEEAVPVLGVAFFPACGELYRAEKGKGAYLTRDRRTRIKVSDVQDLEAARAMTSIFSELDYRDLARAITDLPFKEMKTEGSFAYRVCKVAGGTVDVILNPASGPYKWDTCASQVIVEEAGGLLTDVSGKKLDYTQNSSKWTNSAIATNRLLHNALIEELKRLRGR